MAEQTSLQTNWRHIYKGLDEIHSSVIEAQCNITPKSSLKEAKERIRLLSESMLQERRYVKSHRPKQDTKGKLGYNTYGSVIKRIVAHKASPTLAGVNLGKELQIVNNYLDGLLNAFEDEKTVKELKPYFQKVEDKIKGIASEVLSKVDNQVVDKFVEEQIAKKDAVGTDTETENNEEVTSAVYNDLSDAMKDLANHLKKQQSSDSVDKSASRDIVHMSEIFRKNTDNLNYMKRFLDNSYAEGEDFTIVRGPILTDSALDETRLRSVKIEFDTIYFPGINFGFQRKEATPRMYVLRDQILIAVLMKPPSKPAGFKLKLANKSFTKTLQRDDAKFDQLRKDIISSIASKLNYALVDVTAQREGTNFITNKNFPNIRFIWLLKKSVYSKMGNFEIGKRVAFPF